MLKRTLLLLTLVMGMAYVGYVLPSPVNAQQVSLRDYIERILDERTRAQQAEVTASARTLDTTAEALREKLLEMNQFRIQIERERALYVQKEQLIKDLSTVTERLRVLEEKSANMDGRFWALGVALTVFTAVINVVMWWVSRRRGNAAVRV